MSVMRIGGLASGFDIDQMVKDLMKAERMPMNKLLQQKQILAWKQDGYRELNKMLFSFRDKVFNLKLQSTFNAKTASSSNASAVEVSANANAVDGVYDFSVTQLAKAAYKTSTEAIASFTQGQSLQQQFGFEATDEDKTLSFSINGQVFTFDVTQDSIHTVLNAINNNKDANVRASYDANLKRIFLMTRETGADQKIELADLQGVGGKNLLEDAFKFDMSAASGSNALFKLNGTDLQQSSNNFIINGITFNLKKEGEAATITVRSDTEGLFNQIKGFVDTYNELIEKINGMLAEKRYRDYPPLTEEQKKDMSEKEIALWEEKARSGLFRSDNLLIGIASNMRRILSEVVSGTGSQYNSLAQIGISTKSWYEGGKLHIDEDKLKKALTEDIEGVKSLFTNSGDAPSEKGLGHRLYDAVIAGSSQLTSTAGRDSGLNLVDNSYIGERLKAINTRVSAWEDKLARIEQRYWRQFTLMEQAFNKMNSQSLWLAQQFYS
ncbi:MAG: flagellar filament capping protein FliD [Bacillota bacterium]